MVAVAETQTTKNGGSSLKFLCSYGGRILPRSIDGKLRYVGGFTRVLSVNKSISFSELTAKLEEFCGYSVDLKCQLPDGDLETLISVKSDEDLTNIVEEYVRIYGGKIRAILSPHKHMSPRSSGGSGDQSPQSPFSSRFLILRRNLRLTEGFYNLGIVWLRRRIFLLDSA